MSVHPAVEVPSNLARPLLRHLNIYDLPDELLMDIFGYLRKRCDIKHLRLSSRRLNTTSSHLLMDTVNVSLNLKSLERLENISRHPAISKGIRRLVTSVDVYNDIRAKKLWVFTQGCIHELWRLCENMPSNHLDMNECERVRRFWIAFGDTIDDKCNDCEHLDQEDASAVYNCWLRYRQLYHDQQMILGDSCLPQAIASAVGRMTRLNELVIRDRSRRSDTWEPWSSHTRRQVKNLAKDPTGLVEEMMFRTFSWQRSTINGVEDLPFQLLFQIPLAIHATGVSLAHLKIDVTALKGFQLQIDSGQMSQLKSFGQSLKSFGFSGSSHPTISYVMAADGTEENEDLRKFLTVLTRSSSLVSMALDFAFKEVHCLISNRY